MMKTDAPPAELEEVIARLMKRNRDPGGGAQARAEMDRMREETRKRVGTVEIAAEVIRKIRDE